MKKISNKTLIFIFVIVLILINSVFLFSYYNFYLSDKVASDIVDARNKNHKNLYVLTKSIEGKNLDETIKIIDKYVLNNGGYVSLKDSDGNIIYTNKKDSSSMFSSGTLVYIENNEYELTYSKVFVTPGIKLIRNFVFYEIILISSVIIIIFLISSKTVINPIDMIIKDINDYRFGKRPFKRKMPKNMMQIQNSFVDMVDSLEVEKENQNQIIASISHDIKTPLTSVIGYASMLKNKKLNDDKKQNYVEKIYSKALMMKGILEEFDDYQSCNIKETLKLEKISVKNICNIVKNDFEDDLLDKKIKLSFKINCPNKIINVDVIKLKRVFSNIITNSVNHFNLKEGIIKINVNCKADMIIFEVADNAGGISDETVLKCIFEPLYTTDPSRKISGLGLSICKQIIRTHTGEIYAKNNNMKGLSVIFALPVCFNKS